MDDPQIITLMLAVIILHHIPAQLIFIALFYLRNMKNLICFQLQNTIQILTVAIYLNIDLLV